jgi:hypothetical protein
MVIPYALTYTASKQGVALRRVTCEKCGAQFVYALTRKAVAESTSWFFLDNQGAKERAAENVDRELSEALDRDVDRVPCPKCGLYQSAMFPGIRRDLYWWMIGVAVLFFIGAFVCLVIIPSAAFGHFRGDEPDVELLVAGLIGGVVGGFGLLQWRKRRCRNYDPNADDNKSLRVGKQRVILQEEFERAGPQALFSEIVEQEAKSARSESRYDFYGRFALALFFVGLGPAFLISMREELVDGIASLNWPTASATVVSANIAAEVQGKDRKNVRSYMPEVVYEYQVDGIQYSASRFRFEPIKSEDVNEIGRLIQPYVEKPQLQVHYKPSDPAVSVIVPGLSGFRTIFVVLLVVVPLGALAFCVCDLRRYRKLRQQSHEPAAANV